MGMLWTPYVQKDMGGLSALSGLLVCEHLEVSTLKVELSSFDAKLCFRISSTGIVTFPFIFQWKIGPWKVARFGTLKWQIENLLGCHLNI